MTGTNFRDQTIKDKKRYWANRVTCWYLSGQSLRVFCQTHELDKKRMRYWFYRLNLPRPVRYLKEPEKKDPAIKKRMEAVRFLPVTVTGLEEALIQHPSGVDLVLESGFKIRIHPGFNSEVLIRLMTTLKETLC